MFFVILRFFKFLHLVNESEINRLTVFGMVYDLLDLAQGYAYNTVLFLLNRTPSFAENFLLLFETVNFSIEFAYKKTLTGVSQEKPNDLSDAGITISLRLSA